jgi:hypothetical protein
MILRIREGEVRDNQADHVTWRRKVAIYVSNYKHEAIRVTYKTTPEVEDDVKVQLRMSRCNEGGNDL